MQPGLCFDLRDNVVSFGDIVHFRLIFWRQASFPVALEKLTHPLNGSGRGLVVNNLVRLRAARKKRQELAPEAGYLRPALLQAELENFFQMLALRLHLTGQLVGNVYRQLHCIRLPRRILIVKLDFPRASAQCYGREDFLAVVFGFEAFGNAASPKKKIGKENPLAHSAPFRVKTARHDPRHPHQRPPEK